ncbi:MAG: CHAT domain-containing protein, partial [Halothece sp.]
ESAIAALNQALTIYTHQDFPIDWGKTQLVYGDTYQKKYHQDKQPETKAKAITAYQNALTVFTPDSHPPLCLRAATYLGNFALAEANWELTIEAYQKAITAIEQLRNWATNDQRRQEILKDAVDIYANLIHAYVQVGEADKALEIADRSRAQHLVDLMSSNDLYQDGDIPESVQQLLQQYQQTQKQLNQLRDDDSSSKNDNSPNRRPLTCKEASELSKQTYQQHNQAISQLQDQLHQLWLQIRQADSVLAKQIQVTPLSLSQMQGLLSPTTALISFFTTRYHTHIFILRQNAPAEVFTCEGKNRETLQTWLKDHWLLPYTQKTEGEEKLQNWKEQMPSLLAELSQRLQLEELVTNHLQNINELIIIPHLYLHQIPFAALPLQDSYLGDQFTLRIAPSCQILDFCVQRQQLTPQALGVIENASNDLIFSSYEGEEIIKLYENYSSQRLTGKQATLDNYEQLTQNVQILHSSHHAQAQLTQPLESSLKLADGEIKLRDLLLPSWRRPQLLEVFLSCCETQLGKVEMTDDLLSLSAGFLIAGARAVLSTLWQVEDLPTALLAIFYYEARREGISRAAALQQAQKRLREMTGEEFQPYGEQLKRPLEAQIKLLQESYSELRQAEKQAEKESNKELEKQLNAERRRVFLDLDRYEKAKKNIESKMMENQPFSHPYYWSSVVCQGL